MRSRTITQSAKRWRQIARCQRRRERLEGDFEAAQSMTAELRINEEINENQRRMGRRVRGGRS